MRLKNIKSKITVYVSKLGNLEVLPNTIVNVPSSYSYEQVFEAILPFKGTLELLEGFILTEDDVENAKTDGQDGIMSKSEYSHNLNNIVDYAERALSGGDGEVLQFDFDYTTFANSLVTLGNVPENRSVDEVRVIVDIGFNAGTLTVGDSVDTQRLMKSDENYLSFPSTYSASPTYTYTVQTDVLGNFVGNPTIGRGRIIIYLT